MSALARWGATQPELPPPDDETIILTKAFIFAGKSIKGGWNAKQLAALGVAWPPRSGWIGRLIGKRIHKDLAKRFVLAGGKGVQPGLF